MGRLLVILKGFVYELKAFGLYFTEPAKKSKHTELWKYIKRMNSFKLFITGPDFKKKENDEV